MPRTGSPGTSLVVLRGNSGAGKTTVARFVREAYGRGCALVEQDYLRRVVLRERDVPGAIAPGLIAQTARYALDAGYHVICEGMMPSGRYGPMLAELVADHRGRSSVFYLDVSFAESVRRHGTRRVSYTVEDMRGWYRHQDLLGLPGEEVVPEGSTLTQTVELVAGRLPARL
jgi:predicted kinase